VQLIYYLGIFSKLAFYKNPGQQQKVQLPVSVIISARNEAENLARHLPMILEQNYPDFEVVVINHYSYDGTAELLEKLSGKYSHLKVVTLMEYDRYPKGKKYALTLGIKASKNEVLLLTDADCAPSSRNWLKHMQSKFSPGKEIVLGYSPYQKTNNLLNLFIRYETFYTGLQYLSFALAGKPYMGVGRNLAYKRELFFHYKGFASHSHIMSGDDDLFVNETATGTNTEIMIEPDSFMISEPKSTYSSWFRQKSRHMSTGKYYKAKHQLFLGGLTASHLLFYLSLIPFFFVGIWWVVPVSIYAVRLIVQMVIVGKSLYMLRDPNLVWLVPIFDILFIFYYLVFGTMGLFSKNKSW
jgi:biofilm PGA synthesis N-glycosyltransferase PgaC